MKLTLKICLIILTFFDFAYAGDFWTNLKNKYVMPAYQASFQPVSQAITQTVSKATQVVSQPVMQVAAQVVPKPVSQTISQAVSQVVSKAVQVVSQVSQAVTQAVAKVSEVISQTNQVITQSISQIITQPVNTTVQIVNSAKDTATQIVNQVIDTTNKAVEQVIDKTVFNAEWQEEKYYDEPKIAKIKENYEEAGITGEEWEVKEQELESSTLTKGEEHKDFVSALVIANPGGVISGTVEALGKYAISKLPVVITEITSLVASKPSAPELLYDGGTKIKVLTYGNPSEPISAYKIVDRLKVGNGVTWTVKSQELKTWVYSKEIGITVPNVARDMMFYKNTGEFIKISYAGGKYSYVYTWDGQVYHSATEGVKVLSDIKVYQRVFPFSKSEWEMDAFSFVKAWLQGKAPLPLPSWEEVIDYVLIHSPK